ncbi:O-antigen polysaccharide polymerase Wzy [Priestia aryabhattai]
MNFRINIKNLVSIFIIMLFCIYFMGIYVNVIDINHWEKLQLPIVVFIIYCTYSLIKAPNVLSLGANMMVYIYTVLSLLALVILLPWFPDIINIRSNYTMQFLGYPEMVEAISISCIGIAIFVCSTLLFSKIPIGVNRRAFGRGIKDLDDKEWYPSIAYFSFIVLAFAAGYIILQVVLTPQIIISGYSYYNAEVRSDNLFAYAVNLFAFSIVVLVNVGDKKLIKKGLIIFAVASVVLFLMGNRGEVYYPLLAVIAVYTKRGGTVKKKLFFIGIIGSLTIISFIRVFRTVGLSGFKISEVGATFSPVSAIMESLGEMGFQIGPTTYMLRYLNEGGDYRFGGTILYSFSNAYHRFLPVISQPDSASPSAIKTIMPTDYYAFSSIAEAYYNFSIFGIIAFCILIAWILTKNNYRNKNIYIEIGSSMFIVALIQWVRNTSAVLPIYIIYITFIVVGSFIIRNICKGKN